MSCSISLVPYVTVAVQSTERMESKVQQLLQAASDPEGQQVKSLEPWVRTGCQPAVEKVGFADGEASSTSHAAAAATSRRQHSVVAGLYQAPLARLSAVAVGHLPSHPGGCGLRAGPSRSKACWADNRAEEQNADCMYGKLWPAVSRLMQEPGPTPCFCI